MKRKLDKEEAKKVLFASGLKPFSLECLRAKKVAMAKIAEAFRYPYENKEGIEPNLLSYGSAVGCALRVYYDPKHGCVEEMLTVTYLGGAVAARCANVNSVGADLREVAKLLDGGYYDEVGEFERLEKGAFEIEFDKEGHPVVYAPEGVSWEGGE